MELILAATVGGIVTQGIRYAWSCIGSSNVNSKILEQEHISDETKKIAVSQNAPLSTNQFLSQIQERRQSLRHVQTEKRPRQKSDFEIKIEGRRHAMSDSHCEDS